MMPLLAAKPTFWVLVFGHGQLHYGHEEQVEPLVKLELAQTLYSKQQQPTPMTRAQSHRAIASTSETKKYINVCWRHLVV